ncbi:unnamed protein product [Clonostachys chloroleuca]|uniref:Major facilitator superfamily (MFS) profile domain-containing protein n=1 Tax=Clonostachys chloroleuca TaxID=1926264 RepID=A0AA35MCB2_9HYPO|nr:unnamed protein product [Clonostachys chloroleuca]
MQSYLQNKRLGGLVESYLQQAQEEVDQRQVAAGLEKGEQARSDAKVPAAVIQAPIDNDEGRPGQKAYPVQSSLVGELRGVVEQTRSLADGSTEQILLVDWEGPDDPICARNWSISKRALATAQISLIGFAVGATSGIDATVIPQAAKEFGVSQIVESVAIGVYLIGIGIGSLVAGPFSETFGRNAVYVVSMIVFMCWILGTALAPNIAAQIVFRFLAGCSSSTPMVCSGGSVADMWNSLEKTWSFPYYTTLSFVGPMVGSIMGAYIGPSSHILSWRWAEWVILILSGLVLISVVVTMPETYGPLILEWKAAHYRRITGDSRFRSEHEIEDSTLFSRLRVSMTRPFLMITEPIIIAMTMYLSVLYIVLFTFLVGWPYIFERTYGIDQGLAHIIFISMMIGTVSPALLVPFVYKKTAKVIKQAQSQAEGGNKNARFHPEIRLWYGMLGPAVAVPVSLFWMGWTGYSDISIWSPIIASGFFGFGVTGIFICAYMYIIDSYESYSASALTFVALTRYVIAGGMTVAGIPFYENMGTHYTLTILGSISILLMPIPYLLYFLGHRLREKSKYAAALD